MANPRTTQPAATPDPKAPTPAQAGEGAQTAYDGRQIQPGTDIDPTGASGPPAADAEAVEKANPREATGEPPTPNRPIGQPANAPVVPVVVAGAGAAGVSTQPKTVGTVDAHVETPTERARRQFGNAQGVDLLLEACDVLAINPDQSLPLYDGRTNKPADAQTRAFRQLLSWQPYAEGTSADGFESVVLVTAGGLKVRYSANPAMRFDEDTQQRLRQAFNAFKIDPKTKELIPQPLPGDLALPAPAILGFPIKADHVYRRGYANAGGRDEAARRDAAGR